MNIEYSLKTNIYIAQAYGASPYGEQTYSCVPGDEVCLTAEPPTTNPNPGTNPTPAPAVNTTTETAPNTGLFGIPQDMAVASLSGALLVAVAVIGIVYVLVSRSRARKKDEK